MKLYLPVIILLLFTVMAFADDEPDFSDSNFPDKFDYKSSDYSALDSSQIQLLSASKIPPDKIDLVVESLSATQYQQLSTKQVKAITNVASIPPENIFVITRKLSSSQLEELSVEQVQKLDVKNIKLSNLHLVVGDFSENQYSLMTRKQISKTYFLVKNIEHLDETEFNKFVDTKSKEWNGAKIDALDASVCGDLGCQLSESGVLSSTKNQVTLSNYFKDSLFVVTTETIEVRPPKTHVIVGPNKEKITSPFTVEVTDLAGIFGQADPSDQGSIVLDDSLSRAQIHFQGSQSLVMPGNDIRLNNVLITTSNDLRVSFTSTPLESNVNYIAFGSDTLIARPGSDVTMGFLDKNYVHSYSSDANTQLRMTTLSDSTFIKIESRRDEFTDDGKLYAPLITVTGNPDQPLLRMLNGDTEFELVEGLKFNERTSVKSAPTSTEVQSEFHASAIFELAVVVNDEREYTVVTDANNGARVIPPTNDYDFLDVSSQEHCLGDSCSYVFSGVGTSLIDEYLEIRLQENALEIPNHLRYVIVGDKSQQLSHVVDVTSGKVVKTYITSTGRTLGDKSANPVLTEDGKPQFEGNYVTPEGRLRLTEDVRFRSEKYPHAALLNYPRPHDVEKAYQTGVISLEERDAALETLNEGGHDAYKLRSNPYTGMGSVVLFHNTEDTFAKKGRTSAGCYTYRSSDIAEMSEQYVGKGTEIISLPSTKGYEETRSYQDSDEGPFEARNRQTKNIEPIETEMESHLQSTGLLKPNRERLASWLVSQE